jgi:hypothetical protein
MDWNDIAPGKLRGRIGIFPPSVVGDARVAARRGTAKTHLATVKQPEVCTFTAKDQLIA